MMEIKIPKSFDLLGFKWIVEFNNDRCNDKKVYGECSYGESKILLSTSQVNDKLSDDKINQVFFHELTHAILDCMNERDLSNDEKFVNMFGSLLHQSLKTAQFTHEK